VHEVGVGPVHAALLNLGIFGFSVMGRKFCIWKYS